MYSIKLNNHLKEAGIEYWLSIGWIRADMVDRTPGAPETTARNILI